MAALKLEIRDGATKPKALRRNGILPIAVTRRNHTTVEVQAPLLDLTNAIKGSDAHGRFEVLLPEAGKMRVILKQQDIDYVHQRPLHCTLMEVGDDDVIKLDVPVISFGTPEPVDAGQGMLSQPTDHVQIRGKVADMPSQFDVDISGMQIGDTVLASALQLPEHVDLLSSPDAVLFTVQVAKMASIEVPTGDEDMTGEAPADGEGSTEGEAASSSEE